MAEGARARPVRMGPEAVLRHAGWKAWQELLRRREQRSGYAGYHALSARFESEWLGRWGSAGVAAWLRRPGAGRLPVDVAEARQWCVDTCTAEDLALADAAVAGTFDLIGSGPRHLGTPPAWRTDLYTGIEWPLEDAHRLRIVRGDGSDIRTVWELSRCYHFIALARAYWSSGERRYLEAFAAHVDSFIEQNPFGRGPHWASPMDAAIRAANWALGLVLFASTSDVRPELVARLLSNLYATARYVERHREWHPVYRGNHYVANGVGLAYVGALFRDDPRGRRWLRRGVRIIADELMRQVHPDGVSFEGSIGYHRLATQLFGWGAEIVRRNEPDAWTVRHEERLGAMFEFIDAYTPVSGLAPLIGDNDDGHLHVMDARMLREPRRHGLGLPPRPESRTTPEQSRLFPEGGFAVLRHGADHCIVRCGPVGLFGAGSHDHNDQLSFELVVEGRRIVRDSGTFCYTRDLQSRYAFRSTEAHNALQLGAAEQNPIHVGRPWRILRERTHARVIEWHTEHGLPRFVGSHCGFAKREAGPIVQRCIEYLPATRTWRVEDCVLAVRMAERVDWRLHLVGDAVVTGSRPGLVNIDVQGVPITITFPAGLRFALVTRSASNRYGERETQPVVHLSGHLTVSAPDSLQISTSIG